MELHMARMLDKDYILCQVVPIVSVQMMPFLCRFTASTIAQCAFWYLEVPPGQNVCVDDIVALPSWIVFSVLLASNRWKVHHSKLFVAITAKAGFATRTSSSKRALALATL
jgi:hypothetical protein